MVHDLPDVGRDGAQVLGDDRQRPEGPPQPPEQLAGRRLDPLPVGRRAVAGRDFPEADQSPEMVDPDEVEKAQVVFHPPDPPVEPPVLEDVPAVERVAPELSGRAEVIRRDPGHGGRHLPSVELEYPGVGPHVGAVVIDVDGHVADDPDAPLPAAGPERRPLPEKEVLTGLLLPDLRAEGFAQGGHGGGFPVPDHRRPVRPGPVAERALEGDERGVIVQPAGVGRAESLPGRIALPVEEGRAGLFEERRFPGRHAFVVDPVRAPRGRRDQVALPEETVPDQLFGADEERREGERGRAVIRGIAEGRVRGVERQDLPASLPGVGQEVGEPEGLGPQIPDPEGRGQGGHVQEDTAFSFFQGFQPAAKKSWVPIFFSRARSSEDPAPARPSFASRSRPRLMAK